MGNVGLGAGFVGTMIAAIQILKHLGSADPSTLGAAIATAIISILYGLVWKFYFCVPAEARIAGS